MLRGWSDEGCPIFESNKEECVGLRETQIK